MLNYKVKHIDTKGSLRPKIHNGIQFQYFAKFFVPVFTI